MESKTIQGLEKSLLDLLKVIGRPVQLEFTNEGGKEEYRMAEKIIRTRLTTACKSFFSNEARFGVLSENNGKALRDLRKEAGMTRFG